MSVAATSPTSFIKLRRGTFAYLEHGEAHAPLVIALHGFPDCPPTLEPFMKALAANGFRVVAPWLRGYAPSPLDGPFSLRALSADILDLADALAPDATFDVVGHDWGAVLGYAVAAVGDDRLRTLAALSVPHPLAFVANASRSAAQLRRSWYMMFFQLPLLPERVLRRANAGLINKLWRTWSPQLSQAPPCVVDCIGKSMPAPLRYYRNFTRAPARSHDELHTLHDISTPTLQIQGARDGCIGPALAAGQERFFSGHLETEVAANRGHFLHVEAPDWLASRIAAWLDSCAANRS